VSGRLPGTTDRNCDRSLWRSPGGAPEIEVRGVGKSYGGVSVLRGVNLQIRPGEVHGLIGENGAGKSTLLRILGGSIHADEGEVCFDGEAVPMRSPRQAIQHGVSLISQELALVPAATVLDNVFLGRWSQQFGWRTNRPDRARFHQLLADTGFALDPDQQVGSLPIGLQQQVEILKALARGARVLAMDEPTAVLSENEKQHLLELIKKLAGAGTTVILVSHFLEEVLGVADRITVLRDGNLVLTEDAAKHDPRSLVKHMVGRQIDVLYPEPAPVAPNAPVVLRAERITGGPVRDITLQVRAGEILGLAGLVGSGRSETLRLLFGADRVSKGEITVDGQALTRPTPLRAMAAGIALVPESRKDQGLVLVRSVRENIAAATLGGRRLGPFLKRRAEASAVSAMARDVDVRAASLEVPIWTLSGGNQQKALFGKWLLTKPRILLVDEPTRGVDIAAKTQIHRMIVNLAGEGMAVVVVSSDLEELLALAHRVAVLRRGALVAEFDRGTSPEVVISAAFGDEGEGE
jgi:ABC-type sugar transport system ATPase subunit